MNDYAGFLHINTPPGT